MSLNIKRNCVSLDTKFKILDELDKRRSYNSIAREFGVSKSCVAGVHKNRDFIAQLKPVRNELNLNRKRLRLAKHPDLEVALLAWVKLVRSVDENSLSGPMLADKAISLARDLNIADFKASEGWLARFKDRNALKFRHNLTGSDEKASKVVKSKQRNRDARHANFLKLEDFGDETADPTTDFDALSNQITEENFLYDNISSAITVENFDFPIDFEIKTVACDNEIDDVKDFAELRKTVESCTTNNNNSAKTDELPSLDDAKRALHILRRFLMTSKSTVTLRDLSFSTDLPLNHLDAVEKFVISCQDGN